MEPITQAILALAGSVIAALITSSGLWAWLQKKDAQKGAQTQLLLGLAHDRIIRSGMAYIERGSITKDEYEDFLNYLCDPYSKFGGNGLAEKVIMEVKRLPVTAVATKRQTGIIQTIQKEVNND